MNLTLEDVRPLVGGDLVDTDDSKVGRIEDIYLDNQTQRPEWALVHTGLFGRKQVYVPLTNASTSDGKLRAAFSEDQIKHAPHIEPDEELTPDEEASLYEHYGVSSPASFPQDSPSEPEPYPTQAGPAPESDPASMPSPSRPSSDDAMTRSEEELQVGVVRKPSSLVRLRKYIVTEHVQTTVPVSHEEVRIERIPITDENLDQALSGPDLSDEEHEVTLMAEELVVEKRVVPRERVRLDKTTVTSEEQIEEQLRKEQIDLEQQ